MKNYIQKLDEESEKSLQYAIGKDIQSLMSGNFELYYEVPVIVTTTISISLGYKEYLIISNDWSDTPKEAIDYYFLETRIETEPRDIKTTIQDNSSYSLLHQPNFSSLCLGEISEIKSISIFEFIENGDQESVRYDSALLFERRNSKNCLIKNQHSIAGFLEIITDKNLINTELKKMSCRKTFQK